MASGFCVRVFLLSLLAFGPHAKALSYRSGGSSIIKPYFDQAEGFSGSHKPGSASPKYESPAQPGGFIGSSGPSYPNTDSFDNLKPAGAGGYSGSYGRQVDGYSPDGSVSTYRRSKPRDNPQQPHFKTQLNAKGVLQTKAGMWDVASPQNGNRFESGIATSYGIEMASGHQSETRPQKPNYSAQPQPQPRPHQPSYLGKPQPSYPAQPQPQQPSYPSKPQQPSYPSKPQQPSYPSKPQQPSYPSKPQQPSYPSKPQQPSYPSKPQQPRYPSKPQQPSYPAQPQPQPRPQQPSYPGKPQPSYPAQPSYPSKPQQPSYPSKPQQPSYPAQPKPQQPSYPSKPQPRPQQPSYPSKPHPQLHLQARPEQPSFGMTQRKAGMFSGSHKPGSASPKYESPAQPGGFLGSSRPSYPNTDSFENLKPAGAGGYGGSYGRQVDGYSPEGSVSSYRRSKPRDNPQQPRFKTQLNAKGVLQTKAGMWDVASPQNGNRFESVIASNHGIEMASGHQSETRPQKPNYSAQPQPQLRPQQPSHLSKPQLLLQARPEHPSFGMTQRRPGMWDSPSSQDGDAFDSIEKSTNSEIQPRSYGSLRYWGYI